MNIILSLKVSKNEFFDLENLLKHVLHIEILQNMRYYYSCGLSTATIEYSSLSVCLSVCLSVYTITQKIMVQLT